MHDRFAVETASIDRTCAYFYQDATTICGNWYLVGSQEAMLWCFTLTDSFEQAILLATNLGEDADTTIAICSQLTCASYGVTGILPGGGHF